ncbi:MAG: GTP-binding protein [Thermoplasmata archaeon]|nr:GTP-binding protein [Thermoplasmata archaeon]
MGIIQSKRYIKKVGLIGDSGVGKTSLIRRYVIDVFDDKYIATIGTKVSKRDIEYNLESKTVYLTIMLWDILGQKDYKKIRNQSMRSSHGVIITSDLTRPETVISAGEFWLQEAWETLGEVPVLFVGNKVDIAGRDCEAANALEQLAKQTEMPAIFCSAKTGENVDSAFRKMGEMMISGEFARKSVAPEGECGSLAQAVDEIVNDFCEQYGETSKAMEIVEREFTKASVNIHKPSKDSLLMAIEYLSDVERDIHGRDISEVNKLRRWKMIDEAE